MTNHEPALHARADGRCELCGGGDEHEAFVVPPNDDGTIDRRVFVCASCAGWLRSDEALDPKRWFFLRETIWSAVPAVQVLSYRLLHRLASEPWAVELLEQVYLEDDVLAWAREGLGDEDPAEAAPKTVDAHGNELRDGDAVLLVKDLDVKGAGFVAKQGTRVANIRLTDDPRHVEGRVNNVAIVLKTEFVKKRV